MQSPNLILQRFSILLPDLRGGGAERVCLDLAREFVSAGHNVELITMHDGGELLTEARETCVVTNLGISHARRLPLALSRHLRKRKPDALIAAMWPLTVLAPFAARLSGHRCKVVVCEHGMLSIQYRDWGALHSGILAMSIRAGYRLADHCVGVSSGLVKDMARLSALPESHFTVIHNPIRLQEEPNYHAIAKAEDIWRAPKGLRILTVGALKPVKNQALLIRAFAKLSNKDAELMILGQGSELASLKDLAYELEVDGRIVFAGFHSEPAAFYATADLFVLSSDSEGFGNVIVEALAHGTKVVSTDCPAGPREILGNQEYGLLTPVGDAVALSEAMDTALHSCADGAALRKRAAEFSPQRAAQAYFDLLQK